MNFLKLLLIISLLYANQAWASTSSCYTVTEPVTMCNNTEGMSHIIRASTITAIPFPVKITSITIADNASFLTSGQTGIWQIWLDPNSAYANLNPGYPNQQNGTPGLTLLVMMELQQGQPMHVTRDINSYFNFDANDSLIIDMPCNHPSGQPDFAADMFWTLCWKPNY